MAKQLLLNIINRNSLIRRSKFVAAALAYFAAGIGLLVLISLAVLNYWIAPHISDWRTDIEAMASKYTGAQVHIGQISVNTNQVIPNFVLEDIQIQSEQAKVSNQTLNIPKVSIGLSVLSIMELSFDQLVVDEMDMTLERDVNGVVHILGLPSTQDAKFSGMDWFFSQPDMQLHNAVVHWSDKKLNQDPIEFRQVEVILRNGLKSHALKFELTPPEDLGSRFSVQGKFKESLLTTHPGDINAWSGVAQIDLPDIDLVRAQNYLPFKKEVSIESGRGWIRLWSNIKRGSLNELTVDTSFPHLNFNVNKFKSVDVSNLGGRLIFGSENDKKTVHAVSFKFTADDGEVCDLDKSYFSWNERSNTGKSIDKAASPASSNNDVDQIGAQFKFIPGTGIIGIEKISLQTIKKISNKLPIEPKVKQMLDQLDLAGDLNQFKMVWEFDGQQAQNFSFEGKLQKFKFENLQNHEIRDLENIPGIEAADIEFNFNKNGGNAKLSIEDGSISLPVWLEESNIALAQAKADIRWQSSEKQFELQINNAKLKNDDVVGGFSLSVLTDFEKEIGKRNTIDLSVQIEQGSANQIYKYLPKKLNPRIRNYLQDSLIKGQVENSSIKIKGPAYKLPFVDSKEGEFRVVAHAKDVTYQYYPVSLNESKSSLNVKGWPELDHLNADIFIDRKSLTIKSTNSKLFSNLSNSIEISALNAHVDDLFKPVVSVSAKAKGPLSDAIKVINASAASELMGNALLGVQSASGGVNDYSLSLNLPLTEMSKSKVTGSVSLVNNDISLDASLPPLNKVRGVLNFTETGLSMSNVKAKVLGSDVKLDGGLRFVTDKSESALDNPTLRMQGVMSSEGIRQLKEIPYLASLGKYLSGQSSFNASAVFKKGQLEFELSSSLQGLGIALPAPLNKSFDAAMPLKLVLSLPTDATPSPVNVSSFQSTRPVGAGTSAPQFYSSKKTLKATLSVGQNLLMSFASDLLPTVSNQTSKNAKPPITGTSTDRVWIGIFSSVPAQLPTNSIEPGLSINVDVPKLDCDAWQTIINELSGPLDTLNDQPKGVSKESIKTNNLKLNPNNVRIKAAEMLYSRRSIHQVNLEANYQDLLPNGQWHININSAEAKGTVDYKNASPTSQAKLFARMSLLHIPPTAVDSVDSLLDEKDTILPSVDIVIDDLEVKGKRLGHAEIEAFNQILPDGGKEWRISKLNLMVPEGRFQANGSWSLIKDALKPVNLRKTTLDFNLDVDNAGQLLERLGTKGAVAGGRGKLSGQISWQNSPIQLDYPTMSGRFNVNIEKGSFLKTEPGAARLLGVLNLQALPRRLLLDFKDIFSDGFSFDFFRGDVTIDLGIAKTNNLQMKGVNAAVFLEGLADISKETQHLKVVVIPDIDAGTASLVVAAINPVVGISSYLAQYFLKRPISQAATKDFLVEGTWSDPTVTKLDPKAEFKYEIKPLKP